MVGVLSLRQWHIVGIGALLITLLSPAMARAEDAGSSCTSVRLDVALAAGEPADQYVSGQLCSPQNWAPGSHEVDILTAGATYDHRYWDWPQDPSRYSYVQKTLSSGRATFNYDRVGTGSSSHPLSVTVTYAAEAYILHQIVKWVRDVDFTQINLVGHSYGSMITELEAGTYNDTSRVIATGLLHVPNIGIGLPGLIALLHPAAVDPTFAGQDAPLGYLTTVPGTRGNLFYSAAADPRVVAYDELHKATFPSGGLSAVVPVAAPAPFNVSDKITEPVLVVLGQQDTVFCLIPDALECSSNSALRSAELPYYASAASLTADLVPDTGHDLTLHPSADASFAMINDWVEAH